MKKTFLLSVGIVMAFTGLNAQWFTLNSPTTINLYSTYFTNYDTGYAVGGDLNSSIFLKTVNGGVDWNVITNTQTKWLYDLVFLNDTTGLACGYDGAIYKTTDAGASWVAKPSQTVSALYALAKRPDGIIYATGQDGALIRSTNMGDNWSNVVSSTIVTMLDIQFLDNSFGAAVGYAGEMIYTTDGGNNWAVKLMGTPGSITGVWMISTDTMWTIGLEGKMYKTTDAGQNFVFSTPGLNDLNGIYFTDNLNGYVVGSQIILQTVNGGNNWTTMLNPTSNSLKDIHVSPDNRVMYGVGSNGTIIKNINTIGIETQTQETIQVYPNPTSGKVSISLAKHSVVNIYSLHGHLIKTQAFDEAGNHTLDLCELANGHYILRVTTSSNHIYSRVIVNH